jgi:Protein of unknown function (DUF2505)
VDFEITHRFDEPPGKVAEAMLDEDFQRSLTSLGRLQRELLEQSTQNGRVVRRTRCVLDVEISGMAKSFIGDQDPAWVERATWHQDDRRWDFTIDPEIAKELLEAEGSIQIADDEEGTLRTVAGRVKVKVPLYGGRVEGWIVKGLTDAYDEEAERLRDWMST